MFNSILEGSLSLQTFSICIISALILGLIVALVHSKTARSNSNFATTLTILPVLVTTVILLVNGNLGTAVAVAGAFSLVRFRSVPGNSKEIMNVFFAMAIGLACGTGYIGFAALFTIFTSLVTLFLHLINFGKTDKREKILRIDVPEDFDYTKDFDEEFNKYLDRYELTKAKTINMGSMFEITYAIKLKKDTNEKKFIDDLRIKNSNLKIILTSAINGEEL
jgi:hypothetical protein